MEPRKLLELDVSVLSEEVIEVLLLDGSNSESFVTEMVHKNTHRPEMLKNLLKDQLLPEFVRKSILEAMNIPEVEEYVQEPEMEMDDDTAAHFKSQSLLQRIQKMKMGEKIQLALRGSKDIRTLLLRDNSKEVVMTVLDNPKLTDTEIELIAKQRTTPDDMLRAISKKREWVKSYPIAHALITNPKTPRAISVPLVHILRTKDLMALQKNKNLPEAVRAAVKRKIVLKGR